jgi:hypothetical protein
MKNVQVAEFGVEQVAVVEAADPIPGKGEVLIATEAATINPADFAVGGGVDPTVIGSRVLGFGLWFESLRGTQAVLVTLPVGNVVLAPRACHPPSSPRSNWPPLAASP